MAIYCEIGRPCLNSPLPVATFSISQNEPTTPYGPYLKEKTVRSKLISYTCLINDDMIYIGQEERTPSL